MLGIFLAMLLTQEGRVVHESRKSDQSGSYFFDGFIYNSNNHQLEELEFIGPSNTIQIINAFPNISSYRVMLKCKIDAKLRLGKCEIENAYPENIKVADLNNIAKKFKVSEKSYKYYKKYKNSYAILNLAGSRSGAQSNEICPKGWCAPVIPPP